MENNDSILKIIDSVAKNKAPKELRLLLAKGLMPMNAESLVTVLFILVRDDDIEVKNNAQETIKNIPNSILLGLVQSRKANPAILDFLARQFILDKELIENISLNKNTMDKTVEFIAAKASTEIIDIIGRNQERMSRSPSIVRAILNNPATPKDIMRLIMQFVEREARTVSTKSVTKEDKSELKYKKELELKEKEEKIERAVIVRDEKTKTEVKKIEEIEEIEEEEEEEEEDKLGLFQQIQRMTVAQKINLALKGSKEGRSILIRDSNKEVSLSVLKSPKVSESEVDSFAKSRNMSSDALRLIGANRDWCKNYSIIFGLVSNPKTPIGISLGHINRLVNRNLEQLEKSKDTPEVVRTTAKRILANRKRKS